MPAFNSFAASVVNATITAGGTAQVVVAIKQNRRSLVFQNSSDTAMWINFGATNAAVGTGILVAAGTTFSTAQLLNDCCPKDRVTVFCITTGKTYGYLQA